MPAGLPQVRLPPFAVTMDNNTYTFTEMTGKLGAGVIVTPVVGVLINVAIGKAFGKSSMKHADERTALG